MAVNQKLRKISILGKESIIVGKSLTSYIADDLLSNLKVSSFIIVTDRNIQSTGGLSKLKSALEEHLTKLGLSTRILTFIVPPGEAAKTRSTKERIEDYCLENKCTRDSCFIALGGGVIGDMVGYVAATYMRGVPVIQIPTTMLAMVDSSVGGKTAVDVPSGKNLIGSFHQPFRVYIDIDYLKTLPKRQFINGLAEVIKTAAMWSEDEFVKLEKGSERILALAGHSVDTTIRSEDEDLLIDIILGSVGVKAYVVSNDEKEGGLRGLLNFGHSIGHACEAILTPHILHGEAVSIGMVLEAQLSRFLGKINDAAVGRLIRCLQSYGLPTSPYDKIVKSLAPGKVCYVNDLMDIMKVDKKNKGTTKKIVLLSKIGDTVEKKASSVNDKDIEFVLSHSAHVNKLDTKINKEISLAVPGSKSISNRALVMAALGKGECRLKGLLQSDDVQVMLDALQSMMSIEYNWLNDGEILVIQGAQGKCKLTTDEIYLGNAGTAARFLTSVCSLVDSSNNDSNDVAIKNGTTATIITGNARMKERPIGPLVDALTTNGVDIKYLGKEGSLPLAINEGGLPGGLINLSATVSSQYVSSILISAPYAKSPITLSLGTDKVISQPYIDMTIEMMKTFGINVTRDPDSNVYHIPQGIYQNPENYLIEADASSSTYPLAFAALTASTVTVTNIGSKSLQGDSEFAVKVLKPMGCTVMQTESTTTVTGPKVLSPLESIDMETMTDAFLTATVLAAVAKGKTEIIGIGNQRVKECNRIAVMVEQLALYGVEAGELEDGIWINGVSKESLKVPVNGTKCYDDHRVAMSFSLLALLVGAVIKEKSCTQKTWPGWWDAMNLHLGVQLKGSDFGFDHVEQLLLSDIDNLSSSNVKIKKFRKSNEVPIVLIGMRGAGKSYIGSILSDYLNKEYIDMDIYMQERLKLDGYESLKEYIEKEKWDKFREFEIKSFLDVINNKRNAVVSCGGGIVETAEARDIIKKLIKEYKDDSCKGAVVINIKRKIEDIFSYLNSDPTRPAYGEPVEDVWKRREPLYNECSQFEFIGVSHGEKKISWDGNIANICKQIDFILGTENASISKMSRIIDKFEQVVSGNSKTVSSTGVSTFLCPPINKVDNILEVLDETTECCDAIELRVDLLSCRDNIDEVGETLFLWRGYTDLPIVFTVRTKSQAGTFPEDEKHKDLKTKLFKSAIKWGVEILDVELDTDISEIYELSKSTNTLILGSYHDITGTVVWDESQTHNLGAGGKKRTDGRGIDSKRFIDKYFELYSHSDLIKLVGTAKYVDDNFALRKFVNEINETVSGSGIKPLIAINMGANGKLSRALNDFLTPVTHSKFESVSVAPGQISVRDIHEIRSSLGLYNAKNFFLFGSPITHSPSPDLQNHGFSSAGLESVFKYDIYDTEDILKVVEEVHKPNFGGANVTIPLKEQIISCKSILSGISNAAEKIGAVNTLINAGIELDQDGNQTGRNIIHGDNTDWIGIATLCQQRLESISKKASSVKKRVAIILGAGGTSRAALYASYKIGVKDAIVVNRTLEKAKHLATTFKSSDFYVEAAQTCSDAASIILKNKSSAQLELIVIGTIPGNAQINSKIIEDLEKSCISELNEFISSIVVVDLAYKPIDTPLIKLSEKLKKEGKNIAHVYGFEILTSQGQESFCLWTQLNAPKSSSYEIVSKKATQLVSSNPTKESKSDCLIM